MSSCRNTGGIGAWRRWSPLCLGVLVAQPVLAQGLPGVDAGALLRQQEQAREQAPRELPDPVGPSPLAVPAPAPDGRTVQLSAIRFEGDTDLLPEPDRAAIRALAVGQSLDFGRLQALADAATRAMKARGWILARAYLPPQDLTDGTLVIAILAGRLDSKGAPYRVEARAGAPLRLSRRRLERMAKARLPAGAVVSERQLHAALLTMNELPGITARASLEQGDEPGTTRIVLSATEQPVWHPGLAVNNFGSKSTGTRQVSATLGILDPFGWGDQWDATLVKARGLTLKALDYDRPVGASGLRLHAAHTRLAYQGIAGAASTARLAGTARTSRLALSYPLERSMRSNLSVALGASRETMRDDILIATLNDKRAWSVNLALSGNWLDRLAGGGRTSWSVTPTLGWLKTPTLAAASPGQTGFDPYETTGSFGKVEFQLSRVQKIAPRLSLHVDMRGQLAGKNLDSSQKFFPTGPSGVRAYDGGEASADSGALTQVELAYQPDLGVDWAGLRISAFHDAAWLRLHSKTRGLPIDSASGRNEFRIMGAGLCASLTIKQRAFFKAVWAAPLGRNPNRPRPVSGERASRTSRLWLQAGVQF